MPDTLKKGEFYKYKHPGSIMMDPFEDYVKVINDKYTWIDGKNHYLVYLVNKDATLEIWPDRVDRFSEITTEEKVMLKKKLSNRASFTKNFFTLLNGIIGQQKLRRAIAS